MNTTLKFICSLSKENINDIILSTPTLCESILKELEEESLIKINNLVRVENINLIKDNEYIIHESDDYIVSSPTAKIVASLWRKI